MQRLALNSLHVCTAARQALTSAPRSEDINDIDSQSVRSSTCQPMSSYRIDARDIRGKMESVLNFVERVFLFAFVIGTT